MIPRRGGFSGVLIGIIVAVVLIAIIGAGFVFMKRPNISPTTPTQQTTESSTAQSLSVIQPSSTISATTTEAVTSSMATQSSTASALFTSVSTVGKAYNLDNVATAYNLQLSQAQADYLEQNKFLLLPVSQVSDYSFDSMLDAFDRIGGPYDPCYRAPEDAVFVTPDIVLHAYHKYFDLSLAELEQTDLSPALEKFLTEITGNVAQEITQATPDVAARYQNILAQLTVARVLLENQSPPEPDYFSGPDAENAYLTQDQTIDSFANAKTIFVKYSSFLTPDLASEALSELQLIYAASDITSSPLWGQYKDDLQSDYTQFTPRSHYTKNSALRAYFRAMMYLGRNSYFLGKDIGVEDINLLTNLFLATSSDGNVPLSSWQHISDVTSFYAGQSDDITYTEWQSFLNNVLGNGFNSTPQNLASAATLSTLDSNIGQLKLPKIFSSVVVNPNIGSLTKADLLKQSLGFRIFGQKFTFDAWILNDLTAGQEATQTRLPSMPSALFVPAAFGDTQAQSDTAQFLLNSGFTQADIAGFMAALDQKSGQLQAITADEWQNSLGSAWLNVLSTLTGQYGSSYPLYMQSPNFSDKQIQTFLGSYTELKHDTLLYAKQSYAEKGGGEEECTIQPLVRGFVEPNVAFWKKLQGLINRTEDFYNQYNLFQNSAAFSRLDDFKSIVGFYDGLAEKEMNGAPISDDDYEKLRTTSLSFMAQPFGGQDEPDKDSGKPALVADIHTDALTNQILYEGDGNPYLMLTYVNDENNPRIVVGLAFNHYEFTQPLGGQRLTDEEWRNWVYNVTSSLPTKNFWYQSLIVK